MHSFFLLPNGGPLLVVLLWGVPKRQKKWGRVGQLLVAAKITVMVVVRVVPTSKLSVATMMTTTTVKNPLIKIQVLLAQQQQQQQFHSQVQMAVTEARIQPCL